MINAQSYVGPDNLKFGSAEEADAVAQFGQPVRASINRDRKRELHYKDHIFRFHGATGKLIECTFWPDYQVSINGVPVDWEDGFLAWFVCEDPELKEAHGFLISLKLGIAAVGFHEEDDAGKSVHLFERGAWDNIGVELRPFWPHRDDAAR